MSECYFVPKTNKKVAKNRIIPESSMMNSELSDLEGSIYPNSKANLPSDVSRRQTP